VSGAIYDVGTMWELVEARAAASADRQMLVDEAGRTLTFGQFRDRCEVVAAGLHAMGVGPSTVVSWQLPTRIETVVLSCALARLGGRAIGIVANQPRHLGGVLDTNASQKAARFVRMCNSFGLPLLVLVDTPGFLPGSRQERDGVIRHGAKLVHAFAEASVPSVTVLLRKAFGGAFIAMNSKALGADYVFAWPDAEVGVMGAEQAVGILNRREIAAAEDPAAHRRRLASAYSSEHLHVQGASADGFVDEVIAPETTRPRIASCLEALAGVHRSQSRTRNIPL